MHKIRAPVLDGGEKVVCMYTHRQIWAAIDALADRRGWSIGRLAVTAGLDPTSLNPSKRLGIGAKPRWPSTETLCKLLSASNTSFSSFAEMVEEAASQEGKRGGRPRGTPVPAMEPKSRGVSRR